MNALERACAEIVPPDRAVAEQTQRLLDMKTKPRGSLGKLEQLACRVAAMRGVVKPALPNKAMVVMAGDHGVANEGVSAFPQAVTRQMLLNFAGGGAAINVLSRLAGARLIVADLGVIEPLADDSCVRSLRVAAGTRSFLREPAMTKEQALQALAIGVSLATELADQGVDLVGLGEMGIANTTSASALTVAFTGAPLEQVTGRGTGIDDATLVHKRDVIARSLTRHGPRFDDAVDVLASLGGFEIVGLAGLAIGCASRRVPVIVDGFISSVAALAAMRIAPLSKAYMLSSHRSVEGGHRHVLAALDLEPMFDLDLRLGEGSGAALAMQWVDAALRILNEMSTFEAAGVSDSGA
jgi:nicotinate-nucleotide--dimethylbenzimidazole phosphoribosyltransferase